APPWRARLFPPEDAKSGLQPALAPIRCGRGRDRPPRHCTRAHSACTELAGQSVVVMGHPARGETHPHLGSPSQRRGDRGAPAELRDETEADTEPACTTRVEALSHVTHNYLQLVGLPHDSNLHWPGPTRVGVSNDVGERLIDAERDVGDDLSVGTLSHRDSRDGAS